MKEIALSQGKVALVDDEDYAALVPIRWCADLTGKTWYACRWEKGSTRRMHQDILNAPKGFVIDHKNGDGLDNRRENLRICTRAQNGANCRKWLSSSSRYKGVCWDGRTKKWIASVKVNRQRIWLGRFAREEDAAKAYNEAALRHFGDFALLNVLPLAAPLARETQAALVGVPR